MYTNLDNHPLHPANQDVIEIDKDSRDELFDDMCQYLDESSSSLEKLDLDEKGWYFTKDDDVSSNPTKYRLPTKFWLVAK